MLSIESWTLAGARGRVIRTESHRIFTTTQPTPLLDRLPLFLYDALEAYRTEFTPLSPPRTTLDLYLVRDKVEWAVLAGQVLGVDAASVTGLPRGGVTTGGRALLYDIGPADTFAIAAHEGWHQFTQTTFAEQLPAWLEEGLGTYFEGFKWAPGERAKFLGWCNPGRYESLRTAFIEGRLLPLEALLSRGPSEVAVGDFGEALAYYAQVWALVHFLREGENGRLRAPLESMIADAAAGRLGSTIEATQGRQAAVNQRVRRVGVGAWQAYFGSVTPAEETYRKFVEQAVSTSGRQSVSEGRSPLEP